MRLKRTRLLPLKRRRRKKTIRILPLKILTVNQPFFSTNMQADLKCDSTIPSRYSSITSENNGYIKHKYNRSTDCKRNDGKAKKRTQNGMKSSSLYKERKYLHKLKNQLIMSWSSSHCSIHYTTTLHFTTLYY